MLARTSVGLAPGKKGAPVYSYEALQTSSELDGGELDETGLTSATTQPADQMSISLPNGMPKMTCHDNCVNP